MQLTLWFVVSNQSDIFFPTFRSSFFWHCALGLALELTPIISQLKIGSTALVFPPSSSSSSLSFSTPSSPLSVLTFLFQHPVELSYCKLLKSLYAPPCNSDHSSCPWVFVALGVCFIIWMCVSWCALSAGGAVLICLQPVDDGCGVFHAYQTVISQLRENYHFLLCVTFQRLHHTLNPSCIK